MKTTKFLKLFLTIVAALFVTAAFAQDNAPDPNMTGSSPSGGPATTDSVTVDKLMMYYVEPDPALNNISSAYDTTADRAGNNVNSTFGFDWSGSPGHTINTPTVDADAPFRFIRFNGGTGQATLQATETSAGGCPDPTPTELIIEVIAAPTFTVGGDGTATPICASTGDDGVDVAISSYNVATDGSHLDMLVDVSVDTDDGSGTFSTNVRNVDDSLITVTDPIGTAPSTTVISNYWMGAQGGNITRYTFDFGSGDDEGSSGINDYISRKSDYYELGAGSYTYYAATDAEADRKLVWIVYPTPETGNIYYLPNDFEQ